MSQISSLFKDEAAYEKARTDGLFDVLVRLYGTASADDCVLIAAEIKNTGFMESVAGLATFEVVSGRQSTLVKYPELLKLYHQGQEEGKAWLKGPKTP